MKTIHIAAELLVLLPLQWRAKRRQADKWIQFYWFSIESILPPEWITNVAMWNGAYPRCIYIYILIPSGQTRARMGDKEE